MERGRQSHHFNFLLIAAILFFFTATNTTITTIISSELILELIIGPFSPSLLISTISDHT